MFIQEMFFEHDYVLYIALGTRNAMVNKSDKVPAIIHSELVLAGILRMGQEYGGDGCY